MAKKKHRSGSDSGETLARKKEAVLGGAEQNTKGKVLQVTAAVVALALVAVGNYVFGRGRGDVATPVPADSAAIKIPVSSVNDGRAHAFNHQGISFFVLRSSDGVLRAAFNTCDECYKDRLGYRQEGDLMVCNKCDQSFPSNMINVLRGGCNPAPLKRSIEGDQLVVKTEDIERGRFYFR